MKIFPGHALHHGRPLGGLQPGHQHPGIYAAGECEYSYHGANRLGANSLVSCIYGGFIAGPQAMQYAKQPAKRRMAVSSTVLKPSANARKKINAGIDEN